MKDDRWPDFHHVAQCAAATSLTYQAWFATDWLALYRREMGDQ
jgi:hypothetical protein